MKISAFNWMALSFFGYFCAYGVFVPFFPVWLKSQSYGAETIGFVMAISYLFRFLGGIWFSSLIKRASHLINALRYLAWASFIICLLMSFVAESFWLLCLAIWLFAMVNSAGIPISDTLASTWQQQIHLDYGKARLIGSVAFVVGVTGFGYVIGIIGEQYIVIILTALLLLYSLLQMNSPRQMPLDDQESTVKNSPTFIQLLQNKTTLRLLIAISLIQSSHAAYYVYSVLYWTSIGISVQTTSILLGLSVVSEILLFFFSTQLFKTWSVSALFYLSAGASVVRWLLVSSTDNIALITFTQTFHSLTYAVSHYAIVRYITTQPQTHMAKLQGLYSGISSCGAIALTTALSGVLYPISPTLMFVAMAFFALLALFFTPRNVSALLLKRVNG